MRFEGLLLKESLVDESILEIVQVVRVETWEAVDPPIWTAVFFAGKKDQADHVAEKLAQCLSPNKWYANIATESDSYVIFADKVFKYPRGEEQGRLDAQAYGRRQGVPEDQLDWGEDFPVL